MKRKKSTQKQAFAEHLLNNMTWPERILWSRLRSKQLGYSFQRQAIVMGYVVDFWCPEAKVVIEIDGKVHDLPGRAEEDNRREQFLTRSGIDCLRFPNEDIYHGMSAVILRIWEHCSERAQGRLKTPFIKATLSSRYEETVEMIALRDFQIAKQQKTHEEEFSHRYWKTRSLWTTRKSRTRT